MAVQLRALAEADVRHPIAADQLLPALQTPPFVCVPGLFNTRDLGLLPLLSSSSSSRNSGRSIRPGFIYRTGSLDLLHTNPQGQAVLRNQLRVRRIFDLRSREEHARGPDPVIEGIEAIWDVASITTTSSTTTEESAKVDLAWFVDGEGEAGYVGMYMDVLTSYGPIFGEVLKSVRDRPGDPILFHCTGKSDSVVVFSSSPSRTQAPLSLAKLPTDASLNSGEGSHWCPSGLARVPGWLRP